jgi:predicted acylesterase/phospholipase RssA
MSNSSFIPPKTQRALVLQGGGALGAYEVGVLKVLYEKLIEGKGNGKKEGLLFGIVAGTSIGAMNAAVLISNIVNKNKTWKEAVDELENFWTDKENGLSSDPDISKWWRNEGNDKNKVDATEEALRKYYSVKEYLVHGTPHVCTSPDIRAADNKFGDQKDNLWPHHSSDPLENTIVKYSTGQDKDNKTMRIFTSWDKQQPRLLVVTVDVARGTTVTFDSYHKEEDDPENTLYEGDGITINHIMASGTLPVFYDFRILGGHQFCDGGLLSNTPFRELLQAHQDYWLKVIGKRKDKIPDLEVYIINDHPPRGKSTCINDDDLDGTQDRINDITYSDRNSHFDENVANQATDYIEIINGMRNVARRHFNNDKFDVFEQDFEHFLETKEAKSKLHIQGSGKRTYKDVLNSTFNLKNVVRIENTSAYDDSISGKGADFSSQTIKGLIEKGRDDASKVLTGLEK